MKSGYTIIDHLSDIGIEVKAGSPEDLFKNSALGMFSIMYDLKIVDANEKIEVSVKGEKGADTAELLISWLERLLYVFETKKMIFNKFDITSIDVTKPVKYVKANIYGEKINLSRHKFCTAVKAPTYHMLEVKKNNRNGRIWSARVIFDV